MGGAQRDHQLGEDLRDALGGIAVARSELEAAAMAELDGRPAERLDALGGDAGALPDAGLERADFVHHRGACIASGVGQGGEWIAIAIERLTKRVEHGEHFIAGLPERAVVAATHRLVPRWYFFILSISVTRETPSRLAASD